MGLFDFLKRKKEGNENNENFQEEDLAVLNEEETEIFEEKLPEETAEVEIETLEELPEETNLENIVIAEEIKEDIIEEEEPEKTEEKISFFKKIFTGLDKTRKNIISGIENVLSSFTKIDEDLFEELEEVLIMADIGTQTSVEIIESVKDRVKKEKITEVLEIKKLLIEEITKILEEDNEEFFLQTPAVILVIGVNGVGKTTTIGKLANNYKSQGKKVILAAADTFRAAAIDQLEIWGDRSGIDVIKHQENSDPGAVVFDAVQAAKARKADILICDTAGRLHNKKNLMEELKKICNIINKNFSEAQIEVFLALDSTTGQNAVQQAKLFKEAADITGIVLTKLDGTAKGGVIIAIKNELKIPVRFIGVGEGIEDLRPFDAYEFAKALFGEE